MKKNGFTLIELLAVIVILSVLMLIAVPGILKIMNDTKTDAFVSQAQSILKAAEQQFVVDQTGANPVYTYCAKKTDANSNATGVVSSNLSLTGSTKVAYSITFDGEGKVVDFIVLDGTNSVAVKNTGGISVSDITSDKVLDRDSKDASNNPTLVKTLTTCSSGL